MQETNASNIAVITGAGRGLGKAIAIALANQEMVPVIVDVDESAAASVSDEIRMLGIDTESFVIDISSADQIHTGFSSIARRFGSIDILINNAGVLSTMAVTDVTEQEWDRVMAINIKGAAFATQAALKYMMPKKWGRIINISSMAGRMGGYSTGVAYSVSKAAMIGLTYRVARRVAKHGITVNAIAPGPADTEMVREFTAEERRALEDGIPVGKLIDPEKIAETTAFLVSDAAAFITGTVIDVNGGMFMG